MKENRRKKVIGLIALEYNEFKCCSKGLHFLPKYMGA
jgi:hypothetical protein